MVQTGCSLTPYEALYGFRNTGVDIDINSGVAVYWTEVSCSIPGRGATPSVQQIQL